MITLEMLSFEAGLLLIQRVGPNTKIMRKAKMSFQSGQVKQVIRTYAVEIQTSDKKELDADQVTMKLRKAMGANCERFLCVL
jgi:hypothetical protein